MKRSVIAGFMNKLTMFSIKFAPRFLVARMAKKIMSSGVLPALLF